MAATFTVQRNISSLEEIVDEVPAGTTKLACFNQGLKSLKGIERLPTVTKLFVRGNQITSLEGLAGSNVVKLYIANNQVTSLEGLAGSNVVVLDIRNNQIASLEGLAGSNVITLYILNNPCYQQYQDQFEKSVQKVKDYYNQFLDTPKEPGYD